MKGAVFDWDGTLASIDEREFYCINHALTENGSNRSTLNSTEETTISGIEEAPVSNGVRQH